MKKGYLPERERQLILQSEKWHVVRCSGSIGALDLVCVKKARISEEDFKVRYEQVKSVKGTTFYFDKQSKWELERLKEIEEKFHISCFFSIKFKRYGWKILDVNNLNGKPIKFKEKQK